MSAAEQTYTISPGDASRDWRVTRAVLRHVKQVAAQARDAGESFQVRVGPRPKERTDPQRATMWMWHGQVASELTLRTGHAWTKDDVHEVIFLERFMPRYELIDPETGEVKSRPMRTSDKRTPEGDDRTARQAITDAMDEYLAWITDMGIEVTVPEAGW